MSSSKAVFSFFDPAEINKSLSNKTPKSSNTRSDPVSSSSFASLSTSDMACSTGEISLDYSSGGGGGGIGGPTGAEYDDGSCNSRCSAQTERAANKSPEVVVSGGVGGVVRVSGTDSGEKGGVMDDGVGSHSEAVERPAGSRGSNSGGVSCVGSTDDMKISASSSNNSGVVPRASSASSGVVSKGSGAASTREANYEEGASELFLLVENAAWQEAITRVNQYPEEARVWINSSGTENTVFSWSVWRRLPLHEACRRQPPPVLIYALLAAYPESSMAESHFGELPLHAAVRCGACAEVVNCLLASYPAAVFARDNSGCTPLDILNGTGKMMDHDVVVAALNRTINVLTKEELEWDMKIKTMEKEFQSSKERKRSEYEQILERKNAEIEDLRRELEQEKLATSNLAKKVIQTEKVVELKSTLETRYQERLKKFEEDIKILKTSNSQRKAKIKEMETIITCDKKSITELNSRVQLLQAQFTAVCDEEETFVASTVAKAESQMKILMEAQMMFIKETEKKKERLRARVGRLGITLPPKKFPSDFETPEANEEEDMESLAHAEEPSDEEVAEKALAAAMAQFPTSEENNE